MATVLHRTTKQLIESAHTPDYPIADWIHNPDLSAVSGIDSESWVIEGDTVRAMTAAEKDASLLGVVKSRKTDEIDERTAELISGGFEFPTASGNIFSLSLEGQSTLEGLYPVRDDPALTYPIKWSLKDNSGTYSVVDSAALKNMYLAALSTVRGHKDSGNALKDSVNAATTVAAVDAITDNR